MADAPPNAETPPGVVNMDDMRVNRPMQIKCLGLLLSIAYFIGYATVVYIACTTFVVERVSTKWLQYCIFGSVGVLFCSVVYNTYKAYMAKPLRIPPFFSFSSLACIEPVNEDTSRSDFIKQASGKALNKIKADIDRIYGEHVAFQGSLNGVEICQDCEIVRPMRTYHCKDCDRCYFRLEYHPYFLGQCAHYRNTKFVSLAAFCSLLMNCMIYPVEKYEYFRHAAKFYTGNTEPSVEAPIFLDDPWIRLPVFALLTLQMFFDLYHVCGALVSYKNNSLVYERSVLLFRTETYDTNSLLQNLKICLGPKVWTWFFPVDGTEDERVIHQSCRRSEGFPVPSSLGQGKHKIVHFDQALNTWAERPEDRTRRAKIGDVSLDGQEELVAGAAAGEPAMPAVEGEQVNGAAAGEPAMPEADGEQVNGAVGGLENDPDLSMYLLGPASPGQDKKNSPHDDDEEEEEDAL